MNSRRPTSSVPNSAPALPDGAGPRSGGFHAPFGLPPLLLTSDAAEADDMPLAPGLMALEVPRAWSSSVLGGLAPQVMGQGGRDARPLYCADGANCFDPYAFGTAARRRGHDATEILDRVFVTRAFTIHQLEAVAAGMLAPLAHDPRHQSAACRPLVVVLGIEHLFLEQSLPRAERQRVLGRVLGHLRAMVDAGLTAIATHEPPRTDARAAEPAWWMPAIAQASDWRAQVVQPGEGAPRRLRVIAPPTGRGSPLGLR